MSIKHKFPRTSQHDISEPIVEFFLLIMHEIMYEMIIINDTDIFLSLLQKREQNGRRKPHHVTGHSLLDLEPRHP